MFGTILDKLQSAVTSLFSTAFLLGNFFPVLTIAIVNFVIGWFGIDGFDTATSGWNPVTAATGYAAAELILLLLISVLIAPLVPLLRSLLDGTILPAWLRRGSDDYWRAKRNALNDAAEMAKKAATSFKQAVSDTATALIAARRVGNANPASQDPAAVEAAWAALTKFKDQSDRGNLPPGGAIDELRKAFEEALKKNPTSLGPANPDPDLSLELDSLHVAAKQALDQVASLAKRKADLASLKLRSSFVPDDISPTRVGNARAVIERYPTDAYNIDFDFVWPRLRMVLLKNKDISDAVDGVRAKLDFAVLMTWLSAATIAVWLPVLMFVGHSILTYILLGVLGPFAVFIFYLLVDQTQKSFGESVTMAIDALHFELLASLHQRIPNTLETEREIWLELQRALYAGGGLDIRYIHSSKS